MKYYPLYDEGFSWPHLEHGLTQKNNIYLTTIIQKCSNDSIINKLFGQCPSQKEINEYLNKYSEIYLYFTDIKVDPTNYTHPVQKYLKVISTEIGSPLTFVENYIHFSPVVIRTKIGSLFEKENNINSFCFNTNRKSNKNNYNLLNNNISDSYNHNQNNKEENIIKNKNKIINNSAKSYQESKKYLFEKENNINGFHLNENDKIFKIEKNKSSLKGSKSKINCIKNEIIKIFDENKITERLNFYKLNYNQINNIDNIYKFQEIYENELEKKFNNKIEKIDEINEKYDSELNELFYYMEQENEEKKNDEEESSSATKSLYEGLKKDKDKELDELDKNYKDNIDKIKKDYLDNIDWTPKKYYCEELFKDIQNDILKIIKPKNEKKVTFDFNVAE